MARHARPAAVVRPDNLVRHPRYGAEPRRSGIQVAEAEIRGGHWRLGSYRGVAQLAQAIEAARQKPQALK